MANYIATSEELTAVADAIRAKGGTTETLTFPEGFVSAIGDIQTGGGGGETPGTHPWWPDDTAFLIEHFQDGPTINQIGFTDTFPDTVDILGGVLNPYTAGKDVVLTNLLKEYTEGTVFFDCFAVGTTSTYQRVLTAYWWLDGSVSQRVNIYGSSGVHPLTVEDKRSNIGSLAYKSRFIIGWNETSVKLWYDKNAPYGDVGSNSLTKDAGATMTDMVIGGQDSDRYPYLYNGAIYNLGFVPRLLTDDEAKAIIYR